MRRQKGLALLELAVAAALAVMLVVWAASLLANRAEDARAEAAGRWLLAIRSAAIDMALTQFDALAGVSPPPSDYADLHAPTLDELKRAGHLAADFPLLSPFGQPASVRVLAGGSCPGDDCRPDVLVTTLAMLPGAAAPDPALTGQVLLSAQGYGGAVHPQSPDRLRGALFDLPNPPEGAAGPYPVGTVAVHGGGETGLYARFVRMRDRRDPDLQGGLGVREDVRAGGDVIVGGALAMPSSAMPGDACGEAGRFSRTAAGALLSCQSGRWAMEGGGFGGAYSLNNRYGCRNYTGQSTANPRTGGCSCPAGYRAVIVSEGGKWTETEGWTTGFVCVG